MQGFVDGYKANTNKYSEEDMEAAVAFGMAQLFALKCRSI